MLAEVGYRGYGSTYRATYNILSKFYLGTVFFLGGGGMVRGKYTLGRGLGPSLRKMLVCLYPSTSIRQCLLAGQARAYFMLPLF